MMWEMRVVVKVHGVWEGDGRSGVSANRYTAMAGGLLLAVVHMIVAWALLGGGTAVVSLEGDDAVDNTGFTWVVKVVH